MTASDDGLSGVFDIAIHRVSLLSVQIVILTHTSYHTLTRTMGWEELAADKRSRISKSIPSEWVTQDIPKDDSMFDYPEKSGLLSAQELEWTKSSATELVAKLAKGELKSVDVTLAFCKRATLAQQLVSFCRVTVPFTATWSTEM